MHEGKGIFIYDDECDWQVWVLWLQEFLNVNRPNPGFEMIPVYGFLKAAL